MHSMHAYLLAAFWGIIVQVVCAVLRLLNLLELPVRPAEMQKPSLGFVPSLKALVICSWGCWDTRAAVAHLPYISLVMEAPLRT